MEFIALVATTTVFIFVVFWLFTRLKRPVYRVTQENVETLLQMVLDHTASENDWQVFVAVPFHHDEKLEQVRQTCMVIEEQHHLGFRNRLFTKEGEEKIAEILEHLKASGEKEF